MSENLSTYLLYTLAVINTLIVVRNFEINYRFNDYIRKDKEIFTEMSMSAEKEKAINIFIFISSIIIITIPIKLQLFRENNTALYIQFAQQMLVFFLSLRLNIASTILLCNSACLKFAKALYVFQQECLKNGIEEINVQELSKHTPLPPWKTEPTTILLIEPLLDKYYLKQLKEKVFLQENSKEAIEYVTKQFTKK